jgi:pyruvate dehydrogenase E2 component (dihydrolipoamide acetyltransferase)
MRYIFRFPDIGEGIIEGKLLKWYVKKGQKVKVGDPVVKVETDKVVTDIPSPKEGNIVVLYGKEGDIINVEDPLVEIEIEGVEGEEAKKVAEEKPKPSHKEAIDEKGFGVVGTIEVAGDAAHLPASTEGIPAKAEVEKVPAPKALATPVARAMAKDLGVTIDKVAGTGPGGRVMKKDIRDYYETLQKGEVEKQEVVGIVQKPRVKYQPLSQIRKTIARNMIRSKQSAAHMTVFEEVEVSELIRIRNQYKESFIKEKGVKLTYMPFILKAVTEGLKQHPTLNSEMDLENNRMIFKEYYNIGIAVDTEEGLVVPVIRDVDQLSIFELSKKITEVSSKARDRKLTLEDFKDGTFSVTNYGSIGGTYGVPVINYPQAAILGIGRIMEIPVVEYDEIVIGNVLPISMSVDHRIVDGAEAARFVLKIMEYLKDPYSLFLK